MDRLLSVARLFAGMKRPLSAAVSQLTPHARKIRLNWLRSIKERFKLDPSWSRIFSGMKLEPHWDDLNAGDFKAYASSLERLGRLIENRNLPIELAVGAMACYFESCLPYLDAAWPKAPPGTYTRFMSASQLFLIRGFAQQYHERRSELERSLRESEQHFRRFSIHVVGLYEQTGRSIARDLHDDIGHNLLVLKLYLELMSADLRAGHSGEIEQKIEEAVSLISHAINGVRRLAFNLGPATLEESGLLSTIQRYGGQFSERTGIKVQIRFNVPVKLPSIYDVTLYRVLQGALSNVVAHAKAKRVEVHLGVQSGFLWMSVEDNGKGFDLNKALKDPGQAFGLMAIRQRVELLGGTLRLESRAKRAGKQPTGTRIEVQIPLEGVENALKIS